MTVEQMQQYQEQAAQGRRAAVVRPAMVEYLAAIKAEILRELEQEMISQDRLSTLQNRLYVLRSVIDRVDSDIRNGDIAEKCLREAEADG